MLIIFYDVIETVLPLYKHAVDNYDMNVVKVVTYRNNTRRDLNKVVRQYVFGDDKAQQQFVIGDLLMFQDSYSVADLDEMISNSFEIQVTNVESLDEQYSIWQLEFIHESKPVTIKVLDNSEIKRHAADVSNLFNYAKGLPFGTEERSDALSKAWELKNRYAPVDYSYAITSHKSQGSTYNTVIVDELDIMCVNMTSNKAKSQSIYTAITRAAITCIVVDGQRSDESLSKAVELSMSKLQVQKELSFVEPEV